MTRPVQHDVDQRAQAAGLSKRLSARLGALARNGLFVSDVVFELLEDAQESEPLRALLLSPAISQAAQSLDQGQLTDIAEAVGAAEYLAQMGLTVYRDKDAGCIAVSDEPEVFEGGMPSGDQQGGEKHDASSGLVPLRDSQGQALILKDDERARLLGEHELSEIKLLLLTSTDDAEKIQAVRKLWLSPLQAEQKVQLFLSALSDDSARVRAEAAKGLGSLGLDSRVAQNLSLACSGPDEERLVAVANLEHLLSEGQEREVLLVVSVLIGLLSSQEPERLVIRAISVLGNHLPRLAETYPDLVTRMHTNVQRLLMVPRTDFVHPLRVLYRALLAVRPEETAGLLRHALNEVTASHLRTLFLSLIAGSHATIAREQSLLDLMIDEVAKADDRDPNYIALLTAIQSLGTPVLKSLLRAFEEADESARNVLLGIMSDLVRQNDLRGEAADEVAQPLLDVFESGRPSTRQAIYQSGIFRTNIFGAETTRRAAGLFLQDIHEYELESSRELVAAHVIHLGVAGRQAILEAIAEASHDSTRVAACEILIGLVDRWNDDSELAKDVPAILERVLGLFDDEYFPNRGALYRVAGRLAAHASISLAQARTLAETFLEEARSSSATYDIIEAVGWIASGDSADDELRLELCHVLLGFLQLDLPEISGRVRQVAHELLLEFGRETTAYTDLIPRLLRSLGRVLEREDVKVGLWKHIVDVFSKLFEKVASYKLVWAPGSVIQLAQALGVAASSPHADQRLRQQLTERLMLKANLLPVVEVLGRVCASDDSEPMNVLAQELFLRFEKALNAEERMEQGEERMVLLSMVSMLKRQRIGENEHSDRRMRRKILDFLYAALGRHVVGVREALVELIDEKSAHGVDLTEIEKRLKRFKSVS